MKKRFTFRFKLAYEITLDEDQIYPNYAWYLEPEHLDVLRSRRNKASLTTADVKKTVRANGGPAGIYGKWNMEPGTFGSDDVKDFKVAGLTIVQTPPRRKKKRP